MKLFVSPEEMPKSCAVCPFHVGVDTCFLRLGSPGKFKDVVGGSDKCPLSVFPIEDASSVSDMSDVSSVDSVVRSVVSPEPVLLEHGFRHKGTKVARSWSFVLPMETNLSYFVRCPVCGVQVTLEQGIRYGYCGSCHTYLPTVEIQGMFCGIQFGSHVFIPVRVGDSVLIMSYEVVGFRYDHTRNRGNRFLVKVRSCGFVEGYAPESAIDLPVFSLQEIPLTAMGNTVWVSHYDVERDVVRGRIKWSDLYAFPELLTWPASALDTSLSRLHILDYFSKRPCTVLLTAGFSTLWDLLLCPKEDLLMAPGFDKSYFVDMSAGLAQFAEDVVSHLDF